jgi:hypothetical protein
MKREVDSCLMTHPICQQELRGCHVMLDHKPSKFFLLLFVFYLVIGIVLAATSNQYVEYKMRYDDKCENGQTITVTFDIKENLTGNIFFYYELHNFYQNHFRFRGSQDRNQFHGRYTEEPKKCAPIIVANDNKTTLAPCGLMPLYFFNDFYTFPKETGFTDKGIAWDGEKNNLFNPINEKYTGKSRWMLSGIQGEYFPGELMNEHFMVWMRTANRPTFKKLFARTSTEIQAGKLEVGVVCNFDKNVYSGERYISIVKPGAFGGKNMPLYVASLVLSGFLLVGTVIFAVVPSNRKVQDNSILDSKLIPDEVQTDTSIAV